MVISLSHFGEGKGHYKLLQEHRYGLHEGPGRPGPVATPSLTVTPLRKSIPGGSLVAVRGGGARSQIPAAQAPLLSYEAGDSGGDHLPPP